MKGNTLKTIIQIKIYKNFLFSNKKVARNIEMLQKKNPVKSYKNAYSKIKILVLEFTFFIQFNYYLFNNRIELSHLLVLQRNTLIMKRTRRPF